MISVNKVSRLAGAIALIVSLAVSPVATAQWQADPDDKKQVKAEAAIARVKEKVPRSAVYFEDAYGFAVLHSITRVAFGFGGAYGKGLVFEGDNLIGKTGFWQFTSGLQAGVKNFSMIVFFKDQEALEYFKAREMQFAGQAGIDVATWGAAGTPTYNEGVAIITATKLGLMAEFSYGGIKFTYKDLPQD
jgi:lipid-binding SYLF domain-containing protein